MIIEKELPYKPSNFSMRFLLTAYKYGLFRATYLVRSETGINTCDWLTKNGLLYKHMLPESRYRRYEYQAKSAPMADFIIAITEMGAQYLEHNFWQILTTVPLYYNFPLLMPGDHIKLKEDFKDTSGAIFPKGVYVINSVDRETIVCTYGIGAMSPGPRRVPLYPLRDLASLMQDYLLSPELEFEKRLPKISVPTLVKEMRHLPNLNVAEIIGTLYTTPILQKRIQQEVTS